MTTIAARPSVARAVVVLVAATALAVALNAVVAFVTVGLGAPASYGPLTPPAFATFTVLGAVAGWVGWRLVRARAHDPRRTLAWLVPAVGVLSFVPDLMLLALRFIPGTTTVAVIALMVMHLVVIACLVPAYAVAAPVTARAAARAR